MKEKIFVIRKDVGDKVGKIVEIDNTLSALQEAVDGRIEPFRIGTDAVILCDEEGKLKGKPVNCRVLGETFVGTILVVGTEGEDFTDCPVDLDDWQRYWFGRQV